MSASSDNLAKDIQIFIAGHKKPDLDCILSMLLMKIVLVHKGYTNIEFVFVGQGSTFANVKVTRSDYDYLNDKAVVTHVDTGGSYFDHHTAKNAHKLSSAQIVWETFNIVEFAPEWSVWLLWQTKTTRES